MSDDAPNWNWVMPTEPFDPEVPWGQHLTSVPNLGGWLVHDEAEHFPGDLRGYFWFERLKMGAVQNAREHLDLLLAVLDTLHTTGAELVHATAARNVIGYEGYWQHYMCWLSSQRLCTYVLHPLHKVRLTDEGRAVRLMLRLTSTLHSDVAPRLGTLDRRDVPVLGILDGTPR
ncbi:hypothetical protein [Sphingomonas sp. CFBP 8760]|uniref:hypothetical protein n=1 Tax=Sphingomonas sp. CFBP 8760 TaxID=2775282 RepID=UPI00177C5C57|nr:hypothetical protein [Sphingomonas sp. CFBP 8760]MBD8548286.1 hypothetical protein [Sphingomonas sp. CFBP 8760]